MCNDSKNSDKFDICFFLSLIDLKQCCTVNDKWGIDKNKNDKRVLIKKRLIFRCNIIQTYDDFDQIIKYLLNQYNVKIEKKLEDPDITISYLTINNNAFKLYNDP